MSDRDSIVIEQRADDRSPHAFALRLALRGLFDNLVGAGNRIAQNDRLAHQARFRIHPTAFEHFDACMHLLQDGFHGDAAGNFARVITTHAIGEHQQAD